MGLGLGRSALRTGREYEDYLLSKEERLAILRSDGWIRWSCKAIRKELRTAVRLLARSDGNRTSV